MRIDGIEGSINTNMDYSENGKIEGKKKKSLPQFVFAVLRHKSCLLRKEIRQQDRGGVSGIEGPVFAKVRDSCSSRDSLIGASTASLLPPLFASALAVRSVRKGEKNELTQAHTA